MSIFIPVVVLVDLLVCLAAMIAGGVLDDPPMRPIPVKAKRRRPF